jgi:hypothetical protein
MFATEAATHDLLVPVPVTQVPYMQAPSLPIVVHGGRTGRRRRRGSRQRRGGHQQKLQEHQGHVGNRGGSSYFKVEVCKHYMQGRRCKHGGNCRFAHGTHELRPSVRCTDPKFKSKLCRYYHAINPNTGNIMAKCGFDNRCLFVHEEQWALDRLHHQALIDNAIAGDVLSHGPPDAVSDFSDVDFLSCSESSASSTSSTSSQYSESSVSSTSSQYSESSVSSTSSQYSESSASSTSSQYGESSASSTSSQYGESSVSSTSSQYSESPAPSPRGSVDWTEVDNLEDFSKENVPVSYMKQDIDHPVPFSQYNRSPIASPKNPHYLLNDPRVVWSLLQLSTGWCGYPRRACTTIW